jgi:hypothetical protein
MQKKKQIEIQNNDTLKIDTLLNKVDSLTIELQKIDSIINKFKEDL